MHRGEGRERRHVQDDAATARDEAGQELLRDVEDALDVDAVDTTQVLEPGLEQFADMHHAGVVDQHIDLKSGLLHRLFGLRDRGRIGNVHCDAKHRLAERTRPVPCLADVDVCDHDAGAFADKGRADRKADAGRAARHKSGFSLHSHACLHLDSSISRSRELCCATRQGP
jgi:hypothetical protein